MTKFTTENHNAHLGNVKKDKLWPARNPNKIPKFIESVKNEPNFPRILMEMEKKIFSWNGNRSEIIVFVMEMCSGFNLSGSIVRLTDLLKFQLYIQV